MRLVLRAAAIGGKLDVLIPGAPSVQLRQVSG
jgi:hypothetical protein